MIKKRLGSIYQQKPVGVLTTTLALVAGGSAANIGMVAVAQAQQIEEIQVIGEKIGRSIQDTPTSVAVITPDMMAEQQILNMNDVLDQTPNVHAQPNYGLTIRGIDAFSVSSNSYSYLASVYQDGAPLPYRVIQKGGFSTWDVNQVEVLRGPQSTLQGRNALAGALVVSTQKPRQEWDAKARLTVGEDGLLEKAVAFGGPLIEDTLAFRITAEDTEMDGFNTNTVTGKNSDYNDNQSFRAQLMWTPTDELSVRLSHNNLDYETGVLFTLTPPAGESPYHNRVLDFNSPTREFYEGEITSLEVTYELDNWSLVSISSYSDMDYGYEWDGDASNTGPDLVQLDDRNDETIAQEFRAVFNFEKVKGVIGAYYSDLEFLDKAYGQRMMGMSNAGVTPQALNSTFGLSIPAAQSLLSLYAPADPFILGVKSDQYARVTTYALFSDVTWSVTDKFDLIAGVRYDVERQENGADSLYELDNADALPNPQNYSAPLSVYIDTLNNYLESLVQSASGVTPVMDESFEELLPKLGVSYHWTDNLTTSFIVQKGYRSGGVSRNIAQNKVYTYDPEYLTNYELSMRSTWLDNALVVNANMYFGDWEDQQMDVSLSSAQFDTEVRNVGKSQVKGAELDVRYHVNESLVVYSGLGYADTEFVDFDAGTKNYSGQPFPNAPEWTANVGATYQTARGYFANVNANYADDSIARAGQIENQNDARTVVNTKIGYQTERYGIYLVGTNIFDEAYISRADNGDGTQVYGSPRQWSVSMEASF